MPWRSCANRSRLGPGRGVAALWAVSVVVLLSAISCSEKAAQQGAKHDGLAPITEERPERLVDINPEALYTPEQLAPLLVLSDGALPGTIRGLLASDLPDLLAQPDQIARLDLRIAHDPALWPEEQRPPGTAQLFRAVDLRDCDVAPCTRRMTISAGTELKAHDTVVDGRQVVELLQWLRQQPAVIGAAREASSAQRSAAADSPWLEVRVLLRESPTWELRPRTELDAPRATLVEEAMQAPPGSFDTLPPVDESSMPRWVDEDPDGQMLQQVVDPQAVQLTLTFSVPTSEATAAQLRPLAEWVVSTYLTSPPA